MRELVISSSAGPTLLDYEIRDLFKAHPSILNASFLEGWRLLNENIEPRKENHKGQRAYLKPINQAVGGDVTIHDLSWYVSHSFSKQCLILSSCSIVIKAHRQKTSIKRLIYIALQAGSPNLSLGTLDVVDDSDEGLDPSEDSHNNNTTNTQDTDIPDQSTESFDGHDKMDDLNGSSTNGPAPAPKTFNDPSAQDASPGRNGSDIEDYRPSELVGM